MCGGENEFTLTHYLMTGCMAASGREPPLEALVNWLLEHETDPISESSSDSDDSSTVSLIDGEEHLGAAAAKAHDSPTM